MLPYIIYIFSTKILNYMCNDSNTQSQHVILVFSIASPIPRLQLWFVFNQMFTEIPYNDLCKITLTTNINPIIV